MRVVSNIELLNVIKTKATKNLLKKDNNRLQPLEGKGKKPAKNITKH